MWGPSASAFGTAPPGGCIRPGTRQRWHTALLRSSRAPRWPPRWAGRHGSTCGDTTPGRATRARSSLVRTRSCRSPVNGSRRGPAPGSHSHPEPHASGRGLPPLPPRALPALAAVAGRFAVLARVLRHPPGRTLAAQVHLRHCALRHGAPDAVALGQPRARRRPRLRAAGGHRGYPRPGAAARRFLLPPERGQLARGPGGRVRGPRTPVRPRAAAFAELSPWESHGRPTDAVDRRRWHAPRSARRLPPHARRRGWGRAGLRDRHGPDELAPGPARTRGRSVLLSGLPRVLEPHPKGHPGAAPSRERSG